jgi:23S rRNA (pseudouridine1915-N3)-methyltransferase
MKISLWCIGKTDEKYLVEGIDKYLTRLKHYTKIEYEVLKDVRPGQTPEETLKREADLIFSKLKADDVLVIMDERGQAYDSIGFAQYIQKLQNTSAKNVVFLIGGAFGHHDTIRQRAQHAISLSKMTFSHQMVRLFLVEQLYRAFTIIRGEKYHNE